MWIRDGVPITYHFESLSHRSVARIDFQLQLQEMREPIPDDFLLEEVGEPRKEHKNGGWTHTKTALGFPVESL